MAKCVTAMLCHADTVCARGGQYQGLRTSTTSGPSAEAVPNSAPWPKPSSTPVNASRQHTAARLPLLPWPCVPASICGRHGGPQSTVPGWCGPQAASAASAMGHSI